MIQESPIMHCAGGLLMEYIWSWGGAWSCGVSDRGMPASGPGRGGMCVSQYMQWASPPPVNRITDTC